MFLLRRSFLPAWLDTPASQQGLNLSGVLEDALLKERNIS